MATRARKTVRLRVQRCDPLDENNDFTPRVERQTFPRVPIGVSFPRKKSLYIAERLAATVAHGQLAKRTVHTENRLRLAGLLPTCGRTKSNLLDGNLFMQDGPRWLM